MQSPISPQPEIRNIRTKTIQGGIWVYGRMLFTNIMNLGVMAILARQLNPADFGMVALAQVLARFLGVLASSGITQYVIHDNKPGREERLNTAFWMDIFLSFLSTLIGLVCLPAIIKFYSQPGLDAIIVLSLLRLPISSLSKIPDALLQKSLSFRKIEIRDGALEIVVAIFSIFMALTGWGVLSLVLPGFIASFLRVLLVFAVVDWKPRLMFDLRISFSIFKYSLNVTGGNFLSYILSEGDTLLIGKLMGSYSLGIYNLAWQSANLVARTIVSLINKITFPAFSALSDDLQKLRVAVEQVFRVLAVITFPLLIGLFVVADDFILTIYGAQWKDAILPLRILIIYALRYALGSSTGSVYQAIGRPDINLKIMLVMVPFYFISIWIGSFFSITGVAIAVTLVRTGFGFVDFEILARCLKDSFINIVKPVIPAFLASCLMGLIVFATKISIDRLFPPAHILKLLFLVCSGGFIFLLLIRNHFRSISHDILQVVISFPPPIYIFFTRLLRSV